MFEARDVSVRRGQNRILKSVSASVKPGLFTVIVGPNGAGKSTLLKVITGEMQPEEGCVTFEGRPLSAFAPHEIATRRAVLPQSSQLAFPFTVFEVVRLGLEARVGLAPETRRTLPAALLNRVDLNGFGSRHYQELSGGEQQRVQLARILCQAGDPVADGKPQFLFLDEPTSSLDLRHQIDTLNIARSFADNGGGVLAILHDLNLAALFADRLVVLHKGALFAEGPPSDVITSDLLKQVFEVELNVRRMENSGVPFVLPTEVMRRSAQW